MTAPASITTEPKSHFAMIPKLANDDLDIYEYRLYGHYSQVCGQDGGRCWQSVETIRQKTGMSFSAIKKARNSLQSKGFIDVALPDGKARRSGGNTSVGIVDRWQENAERYQQLVTDSNVSLLNQYIDSIPVPVEEEQRQEEPEKEKRTTTTLLPANSEPVAPVVVSSGGQDFQVKKFSPAKTATSEVLPSKPVLVTPKQQSAPPPGVPADPPAPTPDQQAAQKAYENRWKIALAGDEADKLFAMLAAHDIGYVLMRIINTPERDDRNRPLKFPMRYMATMTDRQPVPRTIQPETEFMKFSGWGSPAPAKEAAPC